MTWELVRFSSIRNHGDSRSQGDTVEVCAKIILVYEVKIVEYRLGQSAATVKTRNQSTLICADINMVY